MIFSTRCLLALLLLLSSATWSRAALIVHEWGTITTRHQPDGTPQGGLNRIDQSSVLPPFVHRFEPEQTKGRPDDAFAKSPETPGRPDVTMRLETPVIYFHPSRAARPEPFDVTVSFRGGILNEYYPKAEASVVIDRERIESKIQAGVFEWDGNVLDHFVQGTIAWKGLQFSKFVTCPETDQNVWLAPRRVKSEKVMVGGEGEQYLFYRGVAHLDALVQTQTSDRGVVVSAPKKLHWMEKPSMTLKHLWLVDIRANGAVAFWGQADVVIAKANAAKELMRLPVFAENEYSPKNADRIRNSMRQALIAGGLYADEADAMLATWGESYFQQPGARIFYMVPKEWIDYHLPLKISHPNETTRVMIGRIDLLK